MIRRLLAIALVPAWIAVAEKPNLEHIYPTAAARGVTNTVQLHGKFEPWPPEAWCSTAGVDFHFSTNKGTAEVIVASDAKVGGCLVRLYNDEGASDPVIFVIAESPHTRDLEPNNHFEKPQRITNFPAIINGRLDKKNDVDSFSFEMKAGQWLDAKVDSHTLMSQVDAVLRLTTTDGYQLAWNHDFASFDPRLSWQAPHDQTVVLQIFGFTYPAGSEIVLSGGNGAVYQVAVSLDAKPASDLALSPAEDAGSNGTIMMNRDVISPAGDEDKFPVTLQKDEIIEIRVDASSFGSDLDPWVKIEDAAGKELARNDDAEGSRDALLEWKAPADGEYHVVVGSLTHRGEADWRYRLHAAKVAPDFSATLGVSGIVLEATGTNEIKVGTKRLRGFTNELSVTISPLPEGVTAEPVKVDGKANEATLKLITKEAPIFNAPVKFVVKDLVTKSERPARFSLVSRSENNGVPGGYSKLLVEDTEEIWLTIEPEKDTKAAEKAKESAAK